MALFRHRHELQVPAQCIRVRSGHRKVRNVTLRSVKGTLSHKPRSVKLGLLAAACLAGASAALAYQPRSAILGGVELTNATPTSCSIAIRVDGEILRIKTTNLGDGRFVLDLAPVVWEGPTRRVRPDCAGVREYRFSLYSRDPLVARIVIEADKAWFCSCARNPAGLLVTCAGPPVTEVRGPSPHDSTIAVVRGIRLSSPLAGIDAEGLVGRSLAFIPRDIVKDGLPHFGAVRDDWLGAPRPHKGIDFYGNQMTVQAVAGGRVVGVGDGVRAGGWVTIDHGKGVRTVYVHVSHMKVKTGDRVTSREPIASVDGAAGNAVDPQLHFELRLDGESVDPVPFISDHASDDLKRKITLAYQRLRALERERAVKVQQVRSDDP
jgi:hypothetical protein